MCRCDRAWATAPQGCRAGSAVLSIVVLLSATTLFSASHEPVGDVANVLFLPRLRLLILSSVAVQGAVSAIALLAAAVAWRPLLLASGLSGVCLALALGVVMYLVNDVTARLEPFLKEECRLLTSARGYSTSPSVAFVDLGLQELSKAFAQCRAGAGVTTTALTLDECPTFGLELDVSGGSPQDLVILERNLETILHCSGLCRPLPTGPLFAVESLDVAQRQLPTCWHPLGITVAAAGRALTVRLGFIAVPAIFFGSLCVIWFLQVLPGCWIPLHGGYRRVHAQDPGMTNFIPGCHAAE